MNMMTAHDMNAVRKYFACKHIFIMIIFVVLICLWESPRPTGGRLLLSADMMMMLNFNIFL